MNKEKLVEEIILRKEIAFEQYTVTRTTLIETLVENTFSGWQASSSGFKYRLRYIWWLESSCFHRENEDSKGTIIRNGWDKNKKK